MKNLIRKLTAVVMAVVMMTGLSAPVSAAKAPKISKKSVSITIGKSYQLYVNYATDSIEWNTSDNMIASVYKGKVTAKNPGTVTITAQHGSTELVCKVKVKAKKGVTIPSKIENPTVTTYNNHTYALFDEACTWKQAKEYCEKYGGHLVTINDKEEQEFINELLNNYIATNKNCYWTGLYKSLNQWKWADGTKYNYKNWARNEPNSYDGEEAYVHLFGRKFTKGNGTKYVGDWNDASNDGAGYAAEFYDIKNFGYICEWNTTI